MTHPHNVFDDLAPDSAFGGAGQPSARPTITRTPPRGPAPRRTTADGGLASLFFPSTAGAQGEQRGAFAQEFLAQIKAGIPVPQAIVEAALGTPGVLEDPSFPKTAQDIAKLFTPAQKTFKTAAPGSAIFEEGTGDVKSVVASPTAQEKLVDAIINAKTPEERKLLERGLAGTDGRLSVTDYLKLTAAGIATDPKLLPRALEGQPPATAEEATIALTLGTAQGPRAPNKVDMLLAALGIEVPGSPLNNLPQRAIQNSLLVDEALRKAEAKPGLVDTILAGTAAGKKALGAAGLSQDKGGGLAELFKTFNKARETPDPIEVAPAEVPVFGAAPSVGGPQGQAPGPQISGALGPDQLKAIEKMPPENFAELSFETLSQITNAVLAKTLKLSEEQKVALLAASKAATSARAN